MLNINFLLKHPSHFIALGFGAGLSKKAPGTLGTLIGIPLYLFIFSYSFLMQIMVAILFIMLDDYVAAFFGLIVYFSMQWLIQ